MAYMNQEKKAKIALALKAVMPADWKYSLSVHNHSSLCLTIRSAPFNILESLKNKEHVRDSYIQVNEFHLDSTWGEPVLSVLQQIKAAMNTGNHNNSDSQSDYHDVGHYVDIRIGSWDRPFMVKT